jgi:DNA-binding response OmpR family regulator
MNKVLLVDDDVELASMLREYIESEGFAEDATMARPAWRRRCRGSTRSSCWT